MSDQNSPLERIQQLQKEIADLQEQAVTELRNKRAALLDEVASIDSELARLMGKNVEKKPGKRQGKGGSGKVLTADELKEMLSSAPGKTLNVRKEGLDLATIKGLVRSDSGLQLGGKGPWPTVKLVG
jgi:uncharacterized protein YdcH (DUF465 family)